MSTALQSKDARRSKSRRRSGVVAALLATLLLVALIAFGSDASTDDDLGIAFALSGLYPDSGLCLFVNAFISRLTLLISSIAPGINAFFILEYCLAAVGVFVFVYVALAYLDDRAVALCAIGLFILLLVAGCTFRKNFTVVATTLTLAGSFALVVQLRQNRLSGPLTVTAVILCVFGFMLRWESFLLMIPFVFVAFVHKLWLNAKSKKPALGMKRTALKLIPFVVVVALCACAYVYDSNEWSSPEWAEWKSYNQVRSMISDYPMPAYSEIEEELSAGGITAIDYDFAQNWRTADNEVFTVDSLKFISSFREEVGDEVVADVMQFKATRWIKMFWFAIPIGIALLVLYILRSRRLNAVSNVAVAAIVVIFAAITFYLASGGRLPQRVMYSVIAGAVVFLAAIIGDKASNSERRQSSKATEKLRKPMSALALVFCLACAGFVVYSSHPSLNNFDTGDKATGSATSAASADLASYSSLTDYIRTHDDILFVMDAKTEYYYIYEYDMKRIPPKDELMRIIMLGGWTTDSPFINARNEMQGMGNVMKGLVENNRARYIVLQSNKAWPSEIETYLETHYWQDVEANLVDSFEAGEETYLIYDFDVVS